MKVLLFAPYGRSKLEGLAKAMTKDDTVKVHHEPRAADLLEIMDDFNPNLVVMFWDGSSISEESREMSNQCWDLIRVIGRSGTTIWVVDDWDYKESKDYQGLCDKVFPEDLFTQEVFAALVKAANPVPA